MSEVESGDADKHGLSESLVIRDSLSVLRALINDLVVAMQGDEGVKYQHIVRSMQTLQGQHEKILSDMARMDAEIIRAHERLDSARRYLRKIKHDTVDTEGQKG